MLRAAATTVPLRHLHAHASSWRSLRAASTRGVAAFVAAPLLFVCSCRHASTLPQPPRPAPPDSAYSSAGLCPAGVPDSSFSSASPTSVPPAAPPSPVLDSEGKETATWTASSSSDLGSPGRVMLLASEVAALSGFNPYRALHECFENVWARTEPQLYAYRIAQVEAELGIRLLTREQEAKEVLDSSSASGLKDQLAQALANVANMTARELDQVKRELKSSAMLLPGLTRDQRVLVADYLRGEVSMAYGSQNEDRALAALEVAAGFSIVDNNRLFYGMQIDTCEVREEEVEAAFASAAAASSAAASSHAQAGISTTASPSFALNDPSPIRLVRPLWVGGRVDGFASTDGRLVEMKNRTGAFKANMPEYDRVQMECYLQVCLRKEGELVERLRTEVDEEEVQALRGELQRARTRVDEARMAQAQEDEEMGSLAVEQSVPSIAAQDAIEDDVDTSFLSSSSEAFDESFLSSFSSFDDAPDDPDAPFPSPADQCEPDEADLSFLDPPSLELELEEQDASFLREDAEDEVQGIAAEQVMSSTSELEGAEDESFVVAVAAASPSASPPNSVGAFPALADATAPPSVAAPLLASLEVLGTELVSPPSARRSRAKGKVSAASAHSVSLTASDVGQQSIVHIVVREAATSAPAEQQAASLSVSSPPPSLAASSSAPPAPAFRRVYLDRLRRTPVQRNDHAWHSQVLPALRSFALFLTKFLASPQMQRLYLLQRTEEEKMRLLAEIVPQQQGPKPTFYAASSSSSYGQRKQEQLRLDDERAALAMLAEIERGTTAAAATVDDDEDEEDTPPAPRQQRAARKKKQPKAM